VGAATVTRNSAEARARRHDLEFGVQYRFAPFSRFGSFVQVSYTSSELKIRGLPTGGAGFGGTIGDLTTSSFSNAGMSADPGTTVGKSAGKLEGVKLAVGVAF
jgi:hypothetical protein